MIFGKKPLNNKDILITSGYPRSGNTYLNQALNLLYYSKYEVNLNKHTVETIEKNNRILVTFRNPIDSIASWHNFPSCGDLQSDVKYYIRFYSFVLNNFSKIILYNFDYFTQDIAYIEDKVLKNFKIETNRSVSDVEVKQKMLANGKEINLPRNNKEELDAVKQQLVNTAGFDQCLDLYKQLQERHETTRA